MNWLTLLSLALIALSRSVVSLSLRDGIQKSMQQVVKTIMLFRTTMCTDTFVVVFNSDKTQLELKLESDLGGDYCGQPVWTNGGSGKQPISSDGVDRYKWTGSSLTKVTSQDWSYIEVDSSWKLTVGRNLATCTACIVGQLYVTPLGSCALGPFALRTFDSASQNAMIYQVGSGGGSNCD